MQLIKCLESFLVCSHFQVNEPQVVDGLHTVSLDAYGLQIKLLRHFELAFHKQAVTFVDKSLGIVSVVGVGEVGIFLRLSNAAEGTARDEGVLVHMHVYDRERA